MTYDGYDCVIDKPEMDDIFIAHYGVKGMKWRHRKGRKVSTSSRRRKDIKNVIKSTYEEQKKEKEERNENVKKNVENTVNNLQYAYKNSRLGQFMNTPIKDTFTKKAYAAGPEKSVTDSGDYIYKKDRKTGKWVSTGRKTRK